jgi:hypothetical protein
LDSNQLYFLLLAAFAPGLGFDLGVIVFGILAISAGITDATRSAER